jgi:HD-like signal output (HDOD) protein
MLALLDSARAPWLAAHHEAREKKLPIWIVESKRLGFNHIEVGGMIAASWGFAPVLVSAIEGHHGPASVYAEEPETAAVAFADRIADCVQEGEIPSSDLACTMPSARALGLGVEMAASLVEIAARNWPEIRV